MDKNPAVVKQEGILSSLLWYSFICFFLATSVFFPFGDFSLQYAIKPFEGHWEWFQIVHLPSNAYFSFFGISETALKVLPWCALIGSVVGVTLLWRQVPYGYFLLLVLLRWYYPDFISLLTISSTLLILASFHYRERGIISAVLCIVGALLSIRTLPLILPAILLYRFFSQEGEPGRERSLWGILLTLTLIALFFTPAPVLPAYPSFAQVVPSDGVEGITHPLVGPDLPLKVQNRAVLHEHFQLFPSLLFFLFFTYQLVRSKDKTLLPSYILFGCVLLDGALPEKFAQIMPLQGYARLIPHLWYLPLALYTEAIVAVLLFCLPSSRQNFWITFVGIGALFYSSPFHQFPGNIPREDPRLASPSAAILLSESRERLEHLSMPSPTVSLRKLTPELRASTEQYGPIASVIDDNPETRWFVKKEGAQDSFPWVAFRLNEAQPFKGLEFSPGHFSTDFPRGISLTLSSSCESLDSFISAKETSIQYTFSPWKGPLFKTQDGYPYYGAEGEVYVDFPIGEVVQCAKITLTQWDPYFDWSIAEVRFSSKE